MDGAGVQVSQPWPSAPSHFQHAYPGPRPCDGSPKLGSPSLDPMGRLGQVRGWCRGKGEKQPPATGFA